MTASHSDVSVLATRRGKLTLLFVCAIAFLDFVDASIVNVALPSIRHDLGFLGAEPPVDPERLSADLRRVPSPWRSFGGPARSAPGSGHWDLNLRPVISDGRTGSQLRRVDWCSPRTGVRCCADASCCALHSHHDLQRGNRPAQGTRRLGCRRGHCLSCGSSPRRSSGSGAWLEMGALRQPSALRHSPDFLLPDRGRRETNCIVLPL